MKKSLLVIKFGTSAITNPNGEPDGEVIARIAKEMAELHQKHHLVLVSSGAVGAGKNFIEDYDGSIAKRKAAAAVGNPLLIVQFSQAFAQYGIRVAQSLCERRHFAKRNLFLQLKSTYQALWENGIVPIANENDVISDRELKFSDNDELATLIAAGFGAERLMIATESGGLLDKEKKLVPFVEHIDEKIMEYVDTQKSGLGLGGMASKLTFAKLATQMGIDVHVFGIKKGQGGILSAYNHASGTHFKAKYENLTASKKWLASGGLTTASLHLDEGAAQAILERKSLLAVGIRKVSGTFDKGEVLELLNAQGKVIAIGRSRVSSKDIQMQKQNLIVAHANDIAVL
ncbi:glutamate 5-kinase [Marinilongibacter aquaticus]|uniref:glutamate 5-kinase n=1 Tax=Marinilongibacter aquaticus TaxID=2975157 RepID=UPI0021BDB52D|nr:glutamate 5-kinase [Marinilongibacter aquaticus]UBM60081.1 glutamate 5-kinase [Marinilongibacter aquaticus]